MIVLDDPFTPFFVFKILHLTMGTTQESVSTCTGNTHVIAAIQNLADFASIQESVTNGSLRVCSRIPKTVGNIDLHVEGPSSRLDQVISSADEPDNEPGVGDAPDADCLLPDSMKIALLSRASQTEPVNMADEKETSCVENSGRVQADDRCELLAQMVCNTTLIYPYRHLIRLTARQAHGY